MASGRIVIFDYMPALDADGSPIPDAQLKVYVNRTTTLATVYADEALTTPLTNPVVSDSSGQFPPIWQDITILFSVGAYSPTLGQFATYDDIAPSVAAATSEEIQDAIALAGGKVNIDGDNASPGFLGLASIPGDFALRVIEYGEPPADGVYIGSGGNDLSFDTIISTPSGGADEDNQRASMVIRGTTKTDGNAEEQTLCILTDIETGYAAPFIPDHVYTAGENFTVPADNNVYRIITGGTSGATPPTTKTTNIPNGPNTLVVSWINDAAINAKLGVYNEVVVRPGAGSSWAMVNNFDLKSGANMDFACCLENDLTNNSGFDSTIGNYNKLGVWIAAQGNSRSTAGLQISSANTISNALIWGAYFAGTKLASNCVIGIDASSLYGIGIGSGAGTALVPTFTGAMLKDSSIAPISIALAGTNSSSAIAVTATTPAALAISGTKTTASILDGSTTPTAFQADGVYSSAALSVTGSGPVAYAAAGAQSTAGFNDAATAPVGFRAAGTYATAAFSTGATTPTAFRAGGANSSSAFASTGTTPAALSMSGTKSLGSIVDACSTPYGIILGGTYSASPMKFDSLPANYADDAAAAAGGLLVGALYRTGSILKVRVV